MSGSQSYTESEITTPCVYGIGTQAVIMEISRIVMKLETPIVDTLATTASATVECQVIIDSATSMAYLSDSVTLVTHMFTFPPVAVANDDVGAYNTVAEFDMEASGFGVLCAARKLYLGVDAAGTNTTATVSTLIVYRLVKVGAGELIGILETFK